MIILSEALSTPQKKANDLRGGCGPRLKITGLVRYSRVPSLSGIVAVLRDCWLHLGVAPKSAKSMTKFFCVPTKICGEGSEFWAPVAACPPP